MLFTTLFPALVIAQNANPSPGLGIALQDSKNFCLIVSPRGSDIAGAEREAKSACYGKPPGALPGFEIPQDMILSAHVIRTPHYTQVTGSLDGTKYGYKADDQGTQFDDSLESQGGVLPLSGCVGYQMYLQYFSSSIYCLRCCNDAFSDYCDPTMDRRGCYAAFPGSEYGPGFTDKTEAAVEAEPVPDFLGCAPKVDTCFNATAGFRCCNSKGDFSKNLPNKTTCQFIEDCREGTIGNLTALPVNRTSTRTTTRTTTTTTIAKTTTTSSTAAAATTTKSSAEHHLSLSLIAFCLFWISI